MSPRSMFVFALILTLAIVTFQPAFAWGRVGHAVIATRAERMLTPQARAQLAPLLHTLGVSSLAEIASWADERRNRGQAKAHFVNMGDDCNYVRARDCPDDQCLVEVVKQRIAVLADVHQDLAHRADALIDVAHFAGGDSSQPLHAGRREDKGGNTYQIQAGNRGTNLHSFWDSGLLYETTHARSEADAVERTLAELDRVAPAHRTAISLRPEDWIAESCQVAHQPGFYPPRMVPGSYIEQSRAVLDEQLIQGSDELAGVLNAALVGRMPAGMGR